MVSTFGFDLASTVAQAQLGDQVAFDAIYDRFADALFRYLYARCGDAALAEELTGDVWVRVVERLPAFRFPGGESFVETQTRIIDTVDRLRERHPGQPIVVVSHADPIRLLLAHAMGSHLDLFQRLVIAPCSISAVVYTPMPKKAP